MGLVTAVIMRSGAWRVIGKMTEIRFDAKKLKSIWRFSAGMSGIALSAILFTQLDKIILSKTLGLEEFGHYMLATVVVSGLYLLIMPTYNTIYPRLSALVAVNDIEKLTELYRLGTRSLATILFPISMMLIVFAEDLVYLWTGNPAIAAKVAPVISLLAIGTALHGIMFFPFALQLAYGKTRLPLTINSLLMVVLVPLTIFLSIQYGAIGGAMAWLVLHVLYILLGTWLTHRQLLKEIGMIWLFQDVAVPLGVTVLVGIVALNAMNIVNYPANINLIFGVVSTLVAIALSFATMPKKLQSILLRAIKCKI